MNSAQIRLSPLHLQLIRALAEDAVARGYLTTQPAPQHDPDPESAKRAGLPEIDHAT